jgi:hypothetical protein
LVTLVTHFALHQAIQELAFVLARLAEWLAIDKGAGYWR